MSVSMLSSLRGRRKLGLIAVVAAALLVGVLTAATAPGRGGDRSAELTGAQAADSCADVLLVGASGSGERPKDGAPFGPTLEPLRSAYVQAASAGKRTVESVYLGAPAPYAPVLRKTPGITGPTSKTVSKSSVVRWEGDLVGTTSQVLTALSDRATACPDQQVVLLGYAQGAMSLHRLLPALERREPGTRLVGTVLVSDGDRAAGTKAWRGGSPRATKGARGVQAFFRTARPDVPVPGSHQAVWSVCTKGDLVCSVGSTGFADALHVHRGYAVGAQADALRGVAGSLWSRTKRWARPIAGLTAQVGSVGVATDEQLHADVADSDAASVVWADVTGLPPGFALSAGGRLTGTPTAIGSWQVSYTVTNSRPGLVHPVPGTFTVRVVDEAPRTISAGGEYSCAVRQEGTLWCWGRNTWGQVGNGTKGPGPTLPTQVGSADTWRSVASGGATTCGIRTSGALFCWGLNNRGQVGDGSTRIRSSPRRIGETADWKQVSLGWFTSCGVRTDGTAWCWGDNVAGQLGGAKGGFKDQPAQVPGDDWASIATGGGWHVCAIKRDGTLWCWGRSSFGQRGDGTLTEAHQPVQVGKGNTWESVSTSWSHTCGVLTSGELRCWGRNTDGQLGDGTRLNKSRPVTVPGLPAMQEVAAGEGSTCGLDRDQHLWCWGSDKYGFLADDNHGSSTTPVRTDFSLRALSAGWMHICGITTGGLSRCWGSNERGQLGDGGYVDAGTPTAQEWP